MTTIFNRLPNLGFVFLAFALVLVGWVVGLWWVFA